jgi:hypothetical protein
LVEGEIEVRHRVGERLDADVLESCIAARADEPLDQNVLLEHPKSRMAAVATGASVWPWPGSEKSAMPVQSSTRAISRTAAGGLRCEHRHGEVMQHVGAVVEVSDPGGENGFARSHSADPRRARYVFSACLVSVATKVRR